MVIAQTYYSFFPCFNSVRGKKNPTNVIVPLINVNKYDGIFYVVVSRHLYYHHWIFTFEQCYKICTEHKLFLPNRTQNQGKHFDRQTILLDSKLKVVLYHKTLIFSREPTLCFRVHLVELQPRHMLYFEVRFKTMNYELCECKSIWHIIRRYTISLLKC